MEGELALAEGDLDREPLAPLLHLEADNHFLRESVGQDKGLLHGRGEEDHRPELKAAEPLSRDPVQKRQVHAEDLTEPAGTVVVGCLDRASTVSCPVAQHYLKGLPCPTSYFRLSPSSLQRYSNSSQQQLSSHLSPPPPLKKGEENERGHSRAVSYRASRVRTAAETAAYSRTPTQTHLSSSSAHTSPHPRL